MAITLDDEPSFCERGARIAQYGVHVIDDKNLTWGSDDILVLYGPNSDAPNCGETSLYWLSPEYKLIQKIPISSMDPNHPSPYPIYRLGMVKSERSCSKTTGSLVPTGEVPLFYAVIETMTRDSCDPGELKCECAGFEPYAPYPYVCKDIGGFQTWSMEYSRQPDCNTQCAAKGISPTQDPIVNTMITTAGYNGIPISYAQAVDIVSSTGSTADDFEKEASYATTDSPMIIPGSSGGAMPCTACNVARDVSVYNYDNILDYSDSTGYPSSSVSNISDTGVPQSGGIATTLGVTYVQDPNNPIESYATELESRYVVAPTLQAASETITQTDSTSKYLIIGGLSAIAFGVAAYILTRK